ncbi:MAG TPA: hypothetical protein VI854_02985 [Acidimicrobiia bacterium]|nr:hypothetical protein [Acidimicrobiia bacterium]
MLLFRRSEIRRVVLALLPLPVLALAAAALGQAGGAEVPGTGDGRDTPAETVVAADPVPEPQRREELLAAYERSRRATWLIDFAFRRRLHNGGRLDLTVVELNRPPDHLIAGLGGRSGTVGGRTIRCEQVEGREICAPQGAAVPFEDSLAEQVSELRDALQPPAKWYAVGLGERRRVAGEQATCFVLTRLVNVPSPPYGDRAEYCFAEDGVPLLARVERREGTDERTAEAVRRVVTDADVEDFLAG